MKTKQEMGYRHAHKQKKSSARKFRRAVKQRVEDEGLFDPRQLFNQYNVRMT